MCAKNKNLNATKHEPRKNTRLR